MSERSHFFVFRVCVACDCRHKNGGSCELGIFARRTALCRLLVDTFYNIDIDCDASGVSVFIAWTFHEINIIKYAILFGQ